ncbi:phage head-tail connector protein (plasmid) [Paraclostridium ghonii]|uniref:phage head-tail connector protein n=1 Tax=Paraclostridium ghonii TaxID=29358 RepID=UPI00202CFF6D|nr:phage head-tail connector protein [Paeniclostridium ghonii]MCM0167593.1 phage head-tail connector protein [Paeniclostridium ghonii]
MIENIKLILEIKDDKFDDLINLYINKVTYIILNYCGLKELNEALESFIEDKVVSIVKPKINGGGTENTGEVKAISRGDTRIEYNVDSNTVVDNSSKSALLTQSDMKYLDSFKTRSWRLL